MAQERRKQKEGGRTLSARIDFVGLEKGEEAPRLEVHLLDRSGKAIDSATLDDNGNFSLPRKQIDAADRVTIAPLGKDPAELESAEALTYRARDFGAMLGEGATIDLSRRDWGRFLFVRRCVDGSVSRCYPYPWFIRNLLLDASRAKVALSTGSGSSLEQREVARLEDALIAQPNVRPPFFPRRCEMVCDGLVEVYRRTCCCRPWIIDDPRLLELIHRLKEIVLEPAKIWPPKPEPDPIREIGLFKQGALDEAALRAEADIAQIRALSAQEQVDYIEARPYLRPLSCSCGDAVKVGRGWIRPDGTFDICWREPLRPLRLGCHDEYAFVVKQAANDETIVIYDGLAANRWFDEASDISLVSYSRQARGCGPPVPAEAGAGAFLQEIGDTPSYLLKTPDADGWDSVATPVYNDGLLNPAATPAAAKGAYKNQNMGGTLKLRYYFGEEMRALGATYYRISIIEADGDGNPTGTRRELGGTLSWRYATWTNAQLYIESEGLGPVTKNNESNLYRIPYNYDRAWLRGDEYHGYLDTREFADARHLLTLEVFDANGQRLRPSGSSGAGQEAAFEFNRWYQPTGLMAVVPFAALTHMLWWDNQQAVAHIADLRKDGVPSGAECQFLSGAGDSTFSVGYRAYHPNPMFLLDHVMWWRRGLGGPYGYLVKSNENAGQFGPVAVTNPAEGNPQATFAKMLGPSQTKCSFALNLHVNVKTTDGEVILDYLDGEDQAAFALELQ
ncbi:MAG TPA: hypothetical protein VNL97_01335 [Solirubrobacterales bacterium]|nr:hypothetical protein [Solirubrobacterales bacterium]